MATLRTGIKHFIVQQLACFESPSAVAALVKAEFGIAVSRQSVEHYDPTKGGEEKRIARQHQELFEATRRRFIQQIDTIGISHKAFRLTQLQQVADHAKLKKNYGLLLETLEQAAKEAGDAYTNRRELSGRGGGPIETVGFTLDQWKEQAAKSLAQVEETMAAFDE
jgi:hypothetical protein